MKIALLGYGKMGKAIEKIAIKRGHEVPLKTDDDGSALDFSQIDVAIDFSVPGAALGNITTGLKNGVPVVSGTTGWLEDYEKAVSVCRETGSAFIYASNFSLGVNIFFEINKKLSQLMGPLQDYDVSIEEIHHTEKLDAPSGTAITLAEQIIKEGNKKGWKLNEASEDEVEITAKRIKDVPGTHRVTYSSETDSIEIKHQAHSRDGFALGAVIAAEWIKDKKGVYSMKDVLFNL